MIKVEGPLWLDSWRGPLAPARFEQYPDRDAGERPYNRCVRFNGQNLGKKDIVLDLKTQEGQELLRRIAMRADVVVANLRPGALQRLDLDFTSLSRSNPSASVVELSVVGAGPDEKRIGLGPTMEAMSGIANLIGYPDTGPLGSGSSYMDPMGALHGAAAALTALYARLETGRGCYVEVAQREAAMTWIGEILLAPSSIEPRCGNAVPHACPHGAFPAQGADEWIAIGVYDQEQWKALCAALGVPELAADPRFASHEARKAHGDLLYYLVAEKTRACDKHSLSRTLQAAGVPAAPVVDGQDLFEDKQLRARRWFTTLSHRDAGTHDYAGLPLFFGGARCEPQTPSPCLGEHTREILRDYAGLAEDDIQSLEQRGVIKSFP